MPVLGSLGVALADGLDWGLEKIVITQVIGGTRGLDRDTRSSQINDVRYTCIIIPSRVEEDLMGSKASEAWSRYKVVRRMVEDGV